MAGCAMSTCSLSKLRWTRLGVLIAAFAITAQAMHAQDLSHPRSPQLGTPAGEALLSETTVLPNGQGLPPGAGNVADGQRLYAQHCLACHGPDGQDGINDVLAGGQGTLTTDAPLKTIGSYWPYATTLFAYVRSAMPYNTPGILSDNEAYALTAYLLYLNNVIAPDSTVTSASLPAITMPNAAGFRRQF